MMQSTFDSAAETQIDRALVRSMLYDILSQCLRPPNRVMMDRLASETTREAICDAARETGLGNGGGPEDLFDAVASARLEELSDEYQRLFGHTAHGQTPPYETEYGTDDPFRQAAELADIGGFYGAFGVRVAPLVPERPDHVGAECEFLSFLACKEAYERIEMNTQALETVRRAEQLFLKEHLGRFGKAFAVSLSKHSRHPFYQASAKLLGELLSSESVELEISLGPEFLEVRQGREEEVPMACGSVCPLVPRPAGDAED